MKVNIEDKIFELREIQWKEGATYVLEASCEMTAEEVVHVQSE
jgi:hypothetical protein